MSASRARSSGDDAGWVAIRIGRSGYHTQVRAGAHAFVIDEPVAAGGSDAGPTPYDYLLGALGGCTAITLRMYADRKGWPLESVDVRLRTSRSHAQDCKECEAAPLGVMWLEREIELAGPLTVEQRQRLLQIADRCPVKQSLERGIRVRATG